MRPLAKALGALVLGAALVVPLSLPAHAEGEVYDENGRLIEAVSEDGVRVQFVYDEEGRLVQERYADGRVVDHEEPEDPQSD